MYKNPSNSTWNMVNTTQVSLVNPIVVAMNLPTPLQTGQPVLGVRNSWEFKLVLRPHSQMSQGFD